MIQILHFARRARMISGEASPDHTHPFWQLDWFHSGKAVLRLDGSEEPVAPGQAVLIAPRVRHTYLLHRGARVGVVKFSSDVPCALPGGFKRFIPDRDELRLLEDLFASREGPRGERIAPHFLAILLLRLTEEPATAGDDLMAGVVSFLAAHLCVPLDVRSLAERCGLSRGHLIRRFKRRYGEPPAVFFKRMRIERAKAHLLEGRKSLALIAEETGYVDVFSFSKAFKKATQMPPSRWRAMAY